MNIVFQIFFRVYNLSTFWVHSQLSTFSIMYIKIETNLTLYSYYSTLLYPTLDHPTTPPPLSWTRHYTTSLPCYSNWDCHDNIKSQNIQIELRHKKHFLYLYLVQRILYSSFSENKFTSGDWFASQPTVFHCWQHQKSFV